HSTRGTSRRSPETSTDSGSRIPIPNSTSAGFGSIPLSFQNPPRVLPTVAGSKAWWGIVAGARAMNSGVDTLSRLLAPRDTPDPTHPVWDTPALHSDRSPPRSRRKPTLQQEPTRDGTAESGGSIADRVAPISHGR
ncbi:unnamed protein product, partial [Tuber aestivum]